jgi:hypothetical protein
LPVDKFGPGVSVDRIICDSRFTRLHDAIMQPAGTFKALSYIESNLARVIGDFLNYDLRDGDPRASPTYEVFE